MNYFYHLNKAFEADDTDETSDNGCAVLSAEAHGGGYNDVQTKIPVFVITRYNNFTVKLVAGENKIELEPGDELILAFNDKDLAHFPKRKAQLKRQTKE